MNPLLLALLFAAEPARPPGLAAELKPPVPVVVDGKPLDVERSGHAAPFVGDIDGDGIPDLLVGQFYDGSLRVYRGAKSRGPRQLMPFEWFRADGKRGRVPEG